MRTREPIRVLIADGQPIFREGLNHLLGGDPDFRVVGAGGTEQETIRLLQEHQPDVLLIDPRMDEGRGLEVLRAFTPDAPRRLRTIIFTDRKDKELMIQSLRYGARGIVMKDSPTSLLFKSIRSVMNGQLWLSNGEVADVVEALQRQSVPGALERVSPRFRLTRREMEIVALVADGEPNKGIGEWLSIREDTVKHHLSTIFNKLGVNSRLELAMFAVHHRLVGTRPEAELMTG